MSMLLSDALQTAIYGRLSGDGPLAAIVGTHIYDAMPTGPVPDLYILIGEETVVDASDVTGNGAIHDLIVSVISTADSFLTLKEAADAVWSALGASELSLARGHLVGFWYRSSTAKRNSSGQRKVDLKFRARVQA